MRNDLNGSAITTAAGKPWRTSSLKDTLTAGYHRAEGRRAGDSEPEVPAGHSRQTGE